KIAVPESNAGKNVEVRLGSPTGTLVGTLTTTATGDWYTYNEQTVELTSIPTGYQTVYIVFAGSSTGVGNFDWFKFSGVAPMPTPTPTPSGKVYYVATDGDDSRTPEQAQNINT